MNSGRWRDGGRQEARREPGADGIGRTGPGSSRCSRRPRHGWGQGESWAGGQEPDAPALGVDI